MSRVRGILKKIIPNSEFGKGVAVLVSGTAGAQVLLLVVVPILTRVYTPAEFGILAIYAGFLAPLAVFGSLRYEIAIPLPVKDSDAIRLVALCFGILVVFCILLLGIVGWLGPWISRMVHAPEVEGYLWLVPFGVFFAGGYQVLKYWAIRKRDYGTIAKTTVTQSFVSSVVQLGGHGFGSIALIIGQILGQSAGISRLALPLARRRRRVFAIVVSGGLLEQGRVYRHFPFYSSWGGVLNTMGVYLPSVLFAALAGPAVAGLYSLTQRVLTVPMSMVGGAIGSVFHGNGAVAYKRGELGALFGGLHRKLALVAMPPALAIALVGPEVFVAAFGPQWRDAGVAAQILAPAFYFQFIIGPISTIFGITGNQRTGLVLQMIMFATRIGGLAAGALWLGFFGAVALFSAATVLSYALFLTLALRVSNVPLQAAVAVTGGALWRGALWVSPIALVRFASGRTGVLVMAMCISILLVAVGLRRELGAKGTRFTR